MNSFQESIFLSLNKKVTKCLKNVIFQFFSSSQENLTIRYSGLIINLNYPYIGASPDTIVECTCCRIRCLEIKCPYSHRGDSIPQMLGKKLYLHKNAEGKVQLMSNHSYYYQVQTIIGYWF